MSTGCNQSVHVASSSYYKAGRAWLAVYSCSESRWWCDGLRVWEGGRIVGLPRRVFLTHLSIQAPKLSLRSPCSWQLRFDAVFYRQTRRETAGEHFVSPTPFPRRSQECDIYTRRAREQREKNPPYSATSSALSHTTILLVQINSSTRETPSSSLTVPEPLFFREKGYDLRALPIREGSPL